jgi:dCMP deaminase
MDKWDDRFMKLTEQVGSWASCYRRKVGAIIVREKRVMTTGYNGAPSGIKSCLERGECLREKLNVQSGTHAELCYAAHAEQNAIIQAARYGININGATLYCTHQPCVICAKMIINAGIKRVVYKEGYPDEFSMKLFEEAGTRIEKYEENEHE